jgi:hypothetical protein
MEYYHHCHCRFEATTIHNNKPQEDFWTTTTSWILRITKQTNARVTSTDFQLTREGWHHCIVCNATEWKRFWILDRSNGLRSNFNCWELILLLSYCTNELNIQKIQYVHKHPVHSLTASYALKYYWINSITAQSYQNLQQNSHECPSLSGCVGIVRWFGVRWMGGGCLF